MFFDFTKLWLKKTQRAGIDTGWYLLDLRRGTTLPCPTGGKGVVPLPEPSSYKSPHCQAR